MKMVVVNIQITAKLAKIIAMNVIRRKNMQNL
jgi:hypothetical protein